MKPKMHQPVLLAAVLDMLQPKLGESYLDLTAGYAGHARAILAKTKAPDQAVLVDRDQYAINYLKQRLDPSTSLIHRDYKTAVEELIKESKQFDMILIDLGVSSPQLDCAERGFSFNKEAKLDMRMDQTGTLSALEVVNYYPQAKLAKIIREYGEETARQAEIIAKTIVMHRPLRTTTALADVISAKFPRHGRTHPATKTFQAIRIEVNQEFVQLEQSLPLLPQLLKPGGRLAIISFHSLEDRRVKQFFRQQFAQGLASTLAPLGKVISGKIEQAFNPRSRSAMLRGAYKK